MPAERPAIHSQNIVDIKEIDAAALLIRSQTTLVPQIGIVLGSGLSALTDHMTDSVCIKYADIPSFPLSSIAGHAGSLHIGLLQGVPCAVMSGRVHGYEGYSADQVAFPVRVLGRLGVKKLILTNASGAINPTFSPGDIMLIRDQINLTGQNPLRGPNIPELGPRFPDMSHTFCVQAANIVHRHAAILGISLKNGIYTGVCGPSYETPAEIRMLRLLGGDAVGMSTIYEVIAGAHMGLPIIGLAVLTNHAAGMQATPLSHEEVTHAARNAANKLISLIENSLGDLIEP